MSKINKWFIFLIGLLIGILFCYIIFTVEGLLFPTFKHQLVIENKKQLHFDLEQISIVNEELQIDYSRNTVVIVYMQNAFTSRGGMLVKLGLFSDKNIKIIKHIQIFLRYYVFSVSLLCLK